MGLVHLKGEKGELVLALSTIEQHSQKMVICRPVRQVSPETKFTGTLIWDSQASRTLEINACCLLPWFRSDTYQSLLRTNHWSNLVTWAQTNSKKVWEM